MWMTLLALIWISSTVVLAALFLSGAAAALYLALKRKRIGFVGLATGFLIATIVAVLANPLANLLLFQKIADENTHAMIEEMRIRCPIGYDSELFATEFGNPLRKRSIDHREIWTYDANPWWMIGWTEIEIVVADEAIEGYFLND